MPNRSDNSGLLSTLHTTAPPFTITTTPSKLQSLHNLVHYPTHRKSEQKLLISVCDRIILFKRSLKHLGVMFNDKLSFTEYVRKKSSTFIEALSRMMSNTYVVIVSKRKLVADVTINTVLHLFTSLHISRTVFSH